MVRFTPLRKNAIALSIAITLLWIMPVPASALPGQHCFSFYIKDQDGNPPPVPNGEVTVTLINPRNPNEKLVVNTNAQGQTGEVCLETYDDPGTPIDESTWPGEIGDYAEVSVRLSWTNPNGQPYSIDVDSNTFTQRLTTGVEGVTQVFNNFRFRRDALVLGDLGFNDMNNGDNDYEPQAKWAPSRTYDNQQTARWALGRNAVLLPPSPARAAPQFAYFEVMYNSPMEADDAAYYGVAQELLIWYTVDIFTPGDDYTATNGHQWGGHTFTKVVDTHCFLPCNVMDPIMVREVARPQLYWGCPFSPQPDTCSGPRDAPIVPNQAYKALIGIKTETQLRHWVAGVPQTPENAIYDWLDANGNPEKHVAEQPAANHGNELWLRWNEMPLTCAGLDCTNPRYDA